MPNIVLSLTCAGVPNPYSMGSLFFFLACQSVSFPGDSGTFHQEFWLADTVSCTELLDIACHKVEPNVLLVSLCCAWRRLSAYNGPVAHV